MAGANQSNDWSESWVEGVRPRLVNKLKALPLGARSKRKGECRGILRTASATEDQHLVQLGPNQYTKRLKVLCR